MDYLQELNHMVTLMRSDVKTVTKTINKARKDSLMISVTGGRVRFFSVSYQNGKRKMRQINADTARIYTLANRAFQRELLRRLKGNEELLSQAISRMQPLDLMQILPSLPKHFEKLDPLRIFNPGLADSGFTYPNPSQSEFPREVRLNIGSMDPYEWAAMPYCENTDHLEYKVHPTRRGVFCRSKSEALLFEIYDSLLIPFHYDEVLSIGDQLISPDFIGVRRDGALIFHEHCGLLTDEYRARNDWKPGLYAVADIYPGINLIYTYDSVSGSLNTGLAEAIIRDIYWL